MDSRTHNCGELTKNNINENVHLLGWVNSTRTHGKIIFIDIRDRFGKTQIILNSDSLILLTPANNMTNLSSPKAIPP